MKGHRPALFICLFFHVAAWAQVCPGLAVTTQPEDTVACQGDPAVLSIGATGGGPLTYQWRKDCVPLPGETDAQLMIDPVTGGDYGSYSCVVADGCGSLTSVSVTLSPGLTPLEIVSQPLDVTVCTGDPATLTIAAVGGNLSYQWRKDCVPLPGETGTSLTLPDVQAADTGDYSCVVANACASLTSNPARVALDTRTGTVTVQPSPVTACPGASVSFSVTTLGPAPKTYQWRKDGVPLAGKTSRTLSLTASEAAVGAYSCEITHACTSVTSQEAALTLKAPAVITTQPMGATVCRNTPVTFEVAATGSTPLSYQWFRNGSTLSGAVGTSLSVTATAATTGTYTCRVTNSCGAVTSDGAVLALIPAPVFTQQPQDLLICSGDTATFTVAVSGTGPFTFQWRKDCEPVPGADAATLTIPFAGFADAGTYVCVVSDACSTVSSNGAALQTAVVCPLNMPDPALRARLIHGAWRNDGLDEIPIDTNGDGLISWPEAHAVRGTLDLTHLNLTDLTGIEAFVNLKVLDASHNRLTFFPNIGGLAALHTLNMAHNRLTALPHYGQLPNLLVLNLAYNQIAVSSTRASEPLPTSLTDLNLRGNGFYNMPNLIGLENLHRLDLSYNRITDLADLAAQTPIGTSPEDVIDLGDNRLLADDCPALSFLFARILSSGAALMYSSQKDLSVLPTWPTGDIRAVLSGWSSEVSCEVVDGQVH